MFLTEKLDIKVFILYLLKNIKEPLEYRIINDLVVQDDFVNYFDFTICFGELVECKQVEEIKDENTSYYTISELGEKAVENVEMRLFTSVREKAIRSALRLLAYYRTGKKISSEIEEADNGYYFVNCNIVNNSGLLMDVKVKVTEKYYAECMKNNFDERAEVIYKGVLALLAGDVNYFFDE